MRGIPNEPVHVVSFAVQHSTGMASRPIKRVYSQILCKPGWGRARGAVLVLHSQVVPNVEHCSAERQNSAPLADYGVMETPNPSPQFCAGCFRAKAYRLPVHRAFFEGRSDLDWFHSVRDYLRWRAGQSWRPARHTGHCIVDSYSAAIHVVTKAFNSTDTTNVSPARRKPPAAFDGPAGAASPKGAASLRRAGETKGVA